MPWIGAAIGVIGAGVSAYGQYEQGVAAKAVGEYNAKLSTQEAEVAQRNSAEESLTTRRGNQRFISGMIADIGASGAKVGEGSNLNDVLNASKELELKALYTEREGQQFAMNKVSEGRMVRAESSAAYSGAVWGATGTLLSGAARAASSLYSNYGGGGLTKEKINQLWPDSGY
jgi:hypothetical protein